tara:strand:+ start:53 stop:493 length:441 start_codon:yes stop_codon:yes gene_type:complete
MSKIIIGIDPDSKAHGVAIYSGKDLLTLKSMPLMELISELRHYALGDYDLTVNIEDVSGVSAAFNARDRETNINVKLKMAQHIGMCKQSQAELERVCEWYKIKVVKHKISKTWKKDKVQFEKITGWSGRSNEDTRSAAYFGWLGVK